MRRLGGRGRLGVVGSAVVLGLVACASPKSDSEGAQAGPLADFHEPRAGIYEVESFARDPMACSALTAAVPAYPFVLLTRHLLPPESVPGPDQAAEGEGCNTPGQCELGLLCVDYICRSCTADSDCGTARCDLESGRCEEREAIWLHGCETAEDCEALESSLDQAWGDTFIAQLDQFAFDRWQGRVWSESVPNGGGPCSAQSSELELRAWGASGFQLEAVDFEVEEVECEGLLGELQDAPCHEARRTRARPWP